MSTTNPADWTDAEIARWMAERDGWRDLYIHDFHGEQILMGYHDKCADMFGPYPGKVPDYPHSLDAAVGWLERMGFVWMREPQQDAQVLITVYDQNHRGECQESDTCTTARALCNAGAAAWMAREAGNV